MSERSSKGTKTLEEWLFDGSDSDSEDDFKQSTDFHSLKSRVMIRRHLQVYRWVQFDLFLTYLQVKRLAMKARQSYLKLLPMHQGIQQRVTDLQILPRKSGGWVVC